MQAIVHAFRREKWPARLSAVISNRADAAGLAFAEQAGIPTRVVASKAYPDRASYDAALQVVIDEYQPDVVVLAGFMRILTPAFVEHYAGRMINIHPSLLPVFKGLHTHRQAIEAGVRIHGATVHFVTPELDGGPIIAQAVVPVLSEDDEDSLADRVLEQEHRLYPRVVGWMVHEKVALTPEGKVKLADDIADSRDFVLTGGGL